MKSEREIIRYMLSHENFTVVDIGTTLNVDMSRATSREKSSKILGKRLYSFLMHIGYRDAACILKNGWNTNRVKRMKTKWCLWHDEETLP